MSVFRSSQSLRPDRSLLGVAYRLMDAALLALSLFLVSLFSPYPWYEPQWQQLYLLAAATAVGLFYLVAEYQGLYLAARASPLWQEIARLWWIWFAVLLGLLLLAYGTKISADYPRRVMFAWFLVAPLSVSAWRVLFGLLLRATRSRSHIRQRVAVFGAGELGQRVALHVLEAPWMEQNLVGFFDDDVTVGYSPFSRHDIIVKGGLDELLEQANSSEIDAVYVALPKGEEGKTQALIAKLADTSVAAYVIPDVFMFDLLHARWVSLKGVPAISVFESPFYGVDGSIKRLADIVLGLPILIAVSLPMLFIACAVKLSSPGPVLFKQRRYGLDGREILVWKFRTMTVCENGPDVKQAMREDPRVTPIGSFLRRFSLDELPQFINVLQGTMSIVGPRPHPVALNEEHRHLIRGYMLRHRVKPGITGLAQVNGWRGETETIEKMEKRIEHDLAYIRNWTLWLDLRIILKTIVRGFKNENAF